MKYLLLHSQSLRSIAIAVTILSGADQGIDENGELGGLGAWPRNFFGVFMP